MFSLLFLSEKELGLQVTISLKANLPALQTKDNMFKFWATTRIWRIERLLAETYIFLNQILR